MLPVALATTHHDPENLLYPLLERWLPYLLPHYRHVVAIVSPVTPAVSVSLLRASGVRVVMGTRDAGAGVEMLGRQRRRVVQEAALMRDITHVHLCDLDRALHWAAFYPDELPQVLRDSIQHPFTVLGRTLAAFASHPRAQRDTEALINHTFFLASGYAWDVTAASRVLARHAIATVLDQCDEDTVGVDCAWVLVAQQLGIPLHYIATDGLEFETLDRYADGLVQSGGAVAWRAHFERDVAQWVQRLRTTTLEVAAIQRWMAREGKEREHDG